MLEDRFAVISHHCVYSINEGLVGKNAVLNGFFGLTKIRIKHIIWCFFFTLSLSYSLKPKKTSLFLCSDRVEKICNGCQYKIQTEKLERILYHLLYAENSHVLIHSERWILEAKHCHKFSFNRFFFRLYFIEVSNWIQRQMQRQKENPWKSKHFFFCPFGIHCSVKAIHRKIRFERHNRSLK